MIVPIECDDPIFAEAFMQRRSTLRRVLLALGEAIACMLGGGFVVTSYYLRCTLSPNRLTDWPQIAVWGAGIGGMLWCLARLRTYADQRDISRDAAARRRWGRSPLPDLDDLPGPVPD